MLKSSSHNPTPVYPSTKSQKSVKFHTNCKWVWRCSRSRQKRVQSWLLLRLSCNRSVFWLIRSDREPGGSAAPVPDSRHPRLSPDARKRRRSLRLGKNVPAKGRITSSVIRWLLGEKTHRLIHKIRTSSILGHAYFFLGNGCNTPGVIPP